MFKNHLKRMLIFMAVIGLAGWLYAYRLPKIYEAKIDIKAGSPPATMDPNLPSSISRGVAGSLQSDLDTDVGYIRSQKVFYDGMVRAERDLRQPDFSRPDNLNRLFAMYDVAVPGALNQYSTSAQRVLQVRVRADSPDQAAALANGIGYAFTDYRRQMIKTATEDGASEIRKQLQTARAESTRLENLYQQTKEKASTADSQAKNQAITQSLEGFRVKRDESYAQLEAARTQAAQFRAKLAVTPKLVPAGSNKVADVSVDIAKQEVSRSRAVYEDLRVQFQDDASQVRDAKIALDRAVARQATAEKNQKFNAQSQTTQQNPAYVELQSSLTQYEAQAAGVEAAIKEYDAAIIRKSVEAAQAPKLEVELQRISRDRETSDKQVTRLESVLTDFEGDVKTRGVQIIAQATPETIQEPVAPEVRRWAILSLLAGALLGLAYSFTIESLRLPVHTSWQLAELTALPVAAAVPAIPKPLARRHEAAIREGSFKPIESFRYMAFSLLARETKPKTMMFTGVGGDVGASSAAAEFAVATARTGTKTILVDCDLRSPQLSTLFGLAGRTGVSDVLGRTVLGGDSADLLVATEHEGLMILPAGTSTEAGLADFQTSHIQGLLNDLAARADLVVLDLPAVDIFSDAARLAQYVDEACLVVSAKTTSYRSIPMAQEIMEKAGAHSMSIVLTNASSNDEPFGTRVSDSLVRA